MEINVLTWMQQMQIAQAIDQQWQSYAEWDRLSYGQLLVLFVAYLLHQSLHTPV